MVGRPGLGGVVRRPRGRGVITGLGRGDVGGLGRLIGLGLMVRVGLVGGRAIGGDVEGSIVRLLVVRVVLGIGVQPGGEGEANVIHYLVIDCPKIYTRRMCDCVNIIIGVWKF